MPTPFRLTQISTSLLFGFLAASALAQQNSTEDIDSTDYAYPVVITPTRLRQSLADVPASVTVITAETIKRYGINNIPDALRLVPGMAVTKSSGDEYRINYHGTGVVSPRRMNVLIDGVSVYRPSFSRVEWVSLPVAIEDVDRIEVTRGPDSASYGPNSMMAVINILTKRPRDVERFMASVEAASHNMVESTMRLANKLGNSTHVSVTANTTRNSGYDNTSFLAGPSDSTDIKRLNIRSQTELASDESLDLHASISQSRRNYNYKVDPFATLYPSQSREELQVGAKWSKALSANHELQIRAYHTGSDETMNWPSCWPKVIFDPVVIDVLNDNPELAVALSRGANLSTFKWRKVPSQEDINRLVVAVNNMGGIATAFNELHCGTVNMNVDETRSHIELQDTYVASDALRFVSGLGMRYQDANSFSYFGGKATNQVRWLFGHVEYRPTSTLTLNLGGYGESNSMGPSTFSPRAAVNYHLTDNQSVRAVYSKGTRTPDLVEMRGQSGPTIEDLSPPVQGLTSSKPVTFLRGNHDLTPERNTSIELGYLVALRQWGMTIDTKAFSERLTNLISDYNANYEIVATNNGGVKLDGIETQASWDLSDGWSGWMSYSYLVNHQANNPVEMTQWSRQSGSLAVSRQFNNHWRGSAAHYFSSGNGVNERLYERTDITLSHDFTMDTLPASATLVLGYLHTPTVNTYLHSIGYFWYSYNSRLSLDGKIRVAF